MRLSAIRRVAAGVVWAAAAATVALLPGLGPMLDHHYAGRQPGHAHVHVGALFPDHLHDHETQHDHHHSGDAASGAEGEDGGLVVVASYSGSLVGRAYVSSSASHTALSFPDPNETPHSFYTDPYGTLRQQSFVAPPTQPPRV